MKRGVALETWAKKKAGSSLTLRDQEDALIAGYREGVRGVIVWLRDQPRDKASNVAWAEAIEDAFDKGEP